MAVKVMLAPAIVRGEVAPSRAPRRLAAGGEKKPRRRRSAVYDADGNEVLITLLCLKCHRMRPLSQFGLRRMTDGSIRNQPWCRTCRSGTSPRARREPVEIAGSPESGETDGGTRAGPEPARPGPDAATLAAQVAAALHGGRG